MLNGTCVQSYNGNTYTDIERLEAVASRGAERYQLGTSIRDTDLEVTVRILLFEYNPNGLLYVDQKATRCGDTLLVMRHSPCADVPLVPECRSSLRMVAMGEGLGKK